MQTTTTVGLDITCVLFDHLIGAAKRRQWPRKAQRVGCSPNLSPRRGHSKATDHILLGGGTAGPMV
jgi:hypothetical protein